MMNPMMNLFKAQKPQEEVVEAQITSEEQEDQDVNSLCYSSLSDDNSETSEQQETQRKIRKRQYSKLAQMVSRMGKEDQDSENLDGPESSPVEIDLSILNLSQGEDDEQKKKVFDRRYSRLAFSVQRVGSEMKK